MEKYSEYKDSGVQWLGMIPGHWDCVKLKSFCKENKEKNKGNLESTVLSLSYGNVIVKQNINFGLVPESYDTYQIVKPGYIILRLTDLQNDHKSLRTGLVKNVGIITSAYIGLIVQNISSEYAQLLLHTYDVKKVFYGMGGGLRQSMCYQDIANLYILVPPLSEQQAIVAFLDGKCGKIDRLLENKQKELDLLQEMKQRIIADAVTRGLDPSVKMKDTGNICLSKVPEHWNVRRYGSLFKLKPVVPHHGEELLSVFLNFGVIRASESDKRTHAASEDLSKYQLVEGTDFVMNNQQAWRGSVGVSKLVGIISPAYHIFKMPACFDPDYANYLLRSKSIVGQFEMSSRGVGSIQRTLNFNWLNNKLVPVPPIAEQRAIVSHINSRVEKIDALASKLQQEIDNIKEYKQRLISDVVTGQIKVC